MSVANPWRGERLLRLPKTKPVKLGASLDHIARLMDATGTDTLEGLQEALYARKPETLQTALEILLGEEKAAALWSKVNGAAGLTAVYVAVSGAVSGLTPEEEEQAKKAEADREREMQAMAIALMARVVGQSSASPSGNG